MYGPRILVITSLFPRPDNPISGIFNFHSVRALSRLADLRVISPVPRSLRRSNAKGMKADLSALEMELERLSPLYRPFVTIPFLGRPLNGYLTYRAVRKEALRLHAERPFDIILSYWLYPDGYGAGLLAERMGLPYVVAALGSDLNIMAESPLVRRKVLKTLATASHVIAVSGSLRDRAEKLGADPNRVTVIHNGVDTSIFHPMDREMARSEVGMGDGAMVLFVGKLDPVKGGDVLIEALSVIPTERRPTLLVAGVGPMRKRLVALASRLHVESSVHFVGTLSPKEIALHLNAADVLCLPSRHEGCPNVVLEALACGTPVVASRVGGIPEIVHNRETGILVDPDEPRGLAEALEQAVQREWNRELISRCRPRTWEDVATETLVVIKHVLGEERQPREPS